MAAAEARNREATVTVMSESPEVIDNVEFSSSAARPGDEVTVTWIVDPVGVEFVANVR